MQQDERGSAPRPPRLRTSSSQAERCGTCNMFDSGRCWGYGNYEVSPDQVCDSWSPETNDRGGRLSVSVISEPRIYSAESPYSFFRDQQRALALNDSRAQGRLVRHLSEVHHEVESGTAEGKRALRELSNELREDPAYRSLSARDRAAREDLGRRAQSAEFRAATSSTISGFTTPQYLVSEFAPYRGTRRAFADQCTILPLPSVGLTMHVPRFTSASSAGVGVEGTSVTELDPSGADNSENVQTISGQITSSQQLIDRTRNMPDGPAYDTVLYNQLKDSYDQSLNNYVLSKAMGLGAKVTGQSSWSNLSTFYQDLSAAREQLTDTNGVHVMATHLFMHPDLYGYLTRQVDSSNRPLIQPQFFPGEPHFAENDVTDGIGVQGIHAGDSRWAQFTGTVAPGVLMWFVDQTIPFAGSNNQWLVSRPSTILVWEDEPTVRAFPETVANQLQVVVQLYCYACCIPRWPGATATVTGGAYPSSDV